MTAKRLSAFTGQINIARKVGESDPLIRGIAYDSRCVGPGFLFFALDGLHTDGHRYVDEAIDRGATAIVCSRPLARYRREVVYLQLDHPRLALSSVSAAYYGHPSQHLDVIGVTGTDGKSSTVYFIHQLLSALGLPSGFVSTVQIMTGETAEKNHYRQSTPEASEVQAILAEMITNGKTVAVIEATSHGLSRRTNRLGDVRFTAGVLTNISHEHLEFHGTLENYVSDKANLFRALEGEGAFGVVNQAEHYADYFRKAARVPVYSYRGALVEAASPSAANLRSAARGADLRAEELHSDRNGTSFVLCSEEGSMPARINLPGLFNVDNALAAATTVWKYTRGDLAPIVELLPALRATVGRMHAVDMGQSFEVIVDYAHTPGAFEKLLPAMRAQTAGRLIAVFGSAGERDIEKRRIQGEIAARHCHMIVLADEDPRGEEPMAILEEIASGMTRRVRGKDLFLIPDRREAICRAYTLARPGDTVLLLGKGHEASIIYSEGSRPWNEIDTAEECLRELGLTSSPVQKRRG